MGRSSVKRQISSPVFLTRDFIVNETVSEYATEKGVDDFAGRDNSAFTVNVGILKSKLNKIYPYRDILVESLPAVEKSIYDQVMNQMKVIHGTSAYQNAMAVITETFGTADTKPGTLGAALVGCTQAAKENRLNGCDPRCLGSLPNDANGSNSCEKQVYIYRDGVLTHKGNNKVASEAYIYIYDPAFVGFNEADKAMLINNAVETIILVNTKNGYIFSDPVAIPQLPIAATKDIVVTTPPSGMYWWQWLLVIILIAIIIGVIIYLIMSSRRKQNLTTQSSWVYNV